jgi:hypothetical protein
MADTHEAAGKHVQKEAPQELFDGQRHHTFLVVMGGVSPTEADFAVCQSDQPVIGNGDAVRIVAEVFEDVFGAAEGPFGVNHPLVPAALE